MTIAKIIHWKTELGSTGALLVDDCSRGEGMGCSKPPVCENSPLDPGPFYNPLRLPNMFAIEPKMSTQMSGTC